MKKADGVPEHTPKAGRLFSSPQEVSSSRLTAPDEAHQARVGFSQVAGSEVAGGPASVTGIDIADSALGGELLLSANGTESRMAALSGPLRMLKIGLAEKVSVPRHYIVMGMRCLIGMGWLLCGLAFWLAATRPDSFGLASNLLVQPMPAAHAKVLAQTFLGVGGVSAVLAFIALIIVNSTLDNPVRLSGPARALGARIAEEVRTLDSDIASAVNTVNDHTDAASAVSILSKAHLKLLEGQIFLRTVSFLQDSPDDTEKLDAFLPKGGSLSPAVIFIAAFILGAFVYEIMFTGDLDNLPKPESFSGIFDYPLYAAILLLGSLLYLFMGIIGEAFVPTLGRTQALRGSLDALRGAYTAKDAPRQRDMVRRVDDAMKVLDHRLKDLERDANAGRAKKSNQHGTRLSPENTRTPPEPQTQPQTQPQAQPQAQPETQPQTRPEPTFTGIGHDATRAGTGVKPHFVDTGFQAAPKPFALDPPDQPPNQLGPSSQTPRPPRGRKR